MRSTHLSVAAIAIGLVLVLPGPAAAQVTTGSIAGSVKDQQGGVIPGATVTLDQRYEGDPIDAGRDEHGRRFRLPERHRGCLHHPGRNAVVQDARGDRASR